MITIDRSWAWIYRRCALWGIATGAGAGAGFGALISGTSYLGAASAFPGGLAGAFYGALAAIVPSLILSAAVAAFLWQRQSRAAGVEDLRRAIGTVFAAVVVIINAAALVAILVTWAPYGLLVLLACDLGGVPVMWWARASMATRWAEPPG